VVWICTSSGLPYLNTWTMMSMMAPWACKMMRIPGFLSISVYNKVHNPETIARTSAASTSKEWVRHPRKQTISSLICQRKVLPAVRQKLRYQSCNMCQTWTYRAQKHRIQASKCQASSHRHQIDHKYDSPTDYKLLALSSQHLTPSKPKTTVLNLESSHQ